MEVEVDRVDGQTSADLTQDGRRHHHVLLDVDSALEGFAVHLALEVLADKLLDQMNAGRAIPYTRPLPGGVTRLARPPRDYGYGYGGGGYGPGYGPRPGGREWVYDRPWTRYPYNQGGSGSVYVR